MQGYCASCWKERRQHTDCMDEGATRRFWNLGRMCTCQTSKRRNVGPTILPCSFRWNAELVITPHSSVSCGGSSASGAQPSVTAGIDQNSGTGDVTRDLRTGPTKDVTRARVVLNKCGFTPYDILAFFGLPFEQVQFLPLMTFCLFLGPTHFSSGFKHFSGEEPAQILLHITFWLFLGPPFEQVRFLPHMTFCLFLGSPPPSLLKS